LTQLKITAPLLKFPKSIGQLKYLEKIVLGPPESTTTVKVLLETLPDEFCHLQCLEHLELRNCSEMLSLPESFGNLKNLQHLDLSFCSKLQRLPNSFGNLIHLKHLRLINCTSLTMSSETLGNIKTLEFIDMRSATKIEVLPPQVAHQRHISVLRLADTNIRQLPSEIGDLRDLEILEIGGPSLEMLPAWLGCLKSLKELEIGCPVKILLPDWVDQLSFSKQLKCLPDSIEELNQLEKLSLNGTGVECLPPCIMALKNLVHLKVQYSPLREVPFKSGRDSPDGLIECMLSLKGLWLVSTRISEIAFGEGICPNLQCLYIYRCERLVEVGTLPATLSKLDLWDCADLENIEGICGLAKLQTLKIKMCPKVEELSGLGTLKSLDTLELYRCRVTGKLGLQQLTKLRVLRVSNCDALEKLGGIKHLMWLRMLNVCVCPKLQCGEEDLEHLRQRAERGLLNLSYDP